MYDTLYTYLPKYVKKKKMREKKETFKNLIRKNTSHNETHTFNTNEILTV